MYDDAWYSSVVATAPSRNEHVQKERRESLLQPIKSSDQIQTQTFASGRETPRLPSPPLATVIRKTTSYTDFHHMVQAPPRQHARRCSSIKRTSTKDASGALDFQNWYHGLSGHLLQSSHDKYRLYRDQLRLSAQHLDSLLDDTDASLDLLAGLSVSFDTVDSQTSALRERSQALLSEQTRISALADDIRDNLEYYNYLDPITRRLNAPGARHFVRGDDFTEMLINLDDCLDYMQNHPNHTETATYDSRYRLLLTRALTLIRVHFTNTLREISADVSKRVAERQLNDTTTSALLYAKFRVNSAELKQLGLEIQKRAVPAAHTNPGAQGEYHSLMNELYQSYSAARGRLIVPLVKRKMAELATLSDDLNTFSRTSTGYIRDICVDEYSLWHEWFEGDGGIYQFLEALCEPLYDYLRPRTIRETHLTKLCELCNLLQEQYMDNLEDHLESPISEQRLDFAILIRPALEDAQSRLVFLALTVLRNDIERYRPKPGDLDYPARNKITMLSGTRRPGTANATKATVASPTSITPSTPRGRETELSHEWSSGGESAFRGWFPTLRKAVWLLSKIYRLVNSSVFDDLAHQIVHQTTLSLHAAAIQISAKKTVIDSQLFLLKQFLVLKQQLVAFDIEFVTPEVNLDFSGVTNTFWELRERGGLFNPGNLMRLVGSGLIPRVVENMLDAKTELDARLRNVISDFTHDSAFKMTTAVSPSTIQKQGFDSVTAMRAVQASVEKEVPQLRTKLDEYLEDLRTKETLIGAVEDQMLQNYEEFFNHYMKLAKTNGTSVSKKGKGKRDDVWDPETFADWTSSVFNVSRIGLDVVEEARSPSPVLSIDSD